MQCAKCTNEGTIRSVSGKYWYCIDHAFCARKFEDNTFCRTRVDQFILYNDLYVCPCIKAFDDAERERKEKELFGEFA